MSLKTMNTHVFWLGLDQLEGLDRTHHVPQTVTSQHHAAVLAQVKVIHSSVGVRGNHKHVLLRVVAPQVT